MRSLIIFALLAAFTVPLKVPMRALLGGDTINDNKVGIDIVPFQLRISLT